MQAISWELEMQLFVHKQGAEAIPAGVISIKDKHYIQQASITWLSWR